ncbi:hypothetical protein [Helicobacter cetorum]|nr:hypothetical protein [Helicobacter cetorum]
MNLRGVSYLRPANNYKGERAICPLTLKDRANYTTKIQNDV